MPVNRNLRPLYCAYFWPAKNYEPKEKEDDLNATDNGESRKESHGASDETQLGLSLDLLVPLDLVVGGRVKVDLHQLEGGLGQFLS